jgi:hypothetical protein
MMMMRFVFLWSGGQTLRLLLTAIIKLSSTDHGINSF